VNSMAASHSVQGSHSRTVARRPHPSRSDARVRVLQRPRRRDDRSAVEKHRDAMDQKTLLAYETAAQAFADEWHGQPAPNDMYALLQRFFKPGLTADIGCGSGRDAAWLVANGHRAVGYDASERLLAQARARYPKLEFATAALPELVGIADETFDNVLCETVIMHLPHDVVVPSVRRLVSILKTGGILYLSWRVTAGSDQRDRSGRLYAAFGADLVLPALAPATLLLDEEVVSASSGKVIHRSVVRKH
jgi:SAM-dependent methyltransferase